MNEEIQNSLKKKKGTCVLVLGMHRSGTSALTGCLNILGFNIGKNLMPPNNFNIKGYFENNSIYKFNDKLLDLLYAQWNDTLYLPQDWWKDERFDTLQKSLIDILTSEFDLTNEFVIKDPRISVLLPFYLSVLNKINIIPKIIVVYRHPKEVAASLKTRDNISVPKSILLWMDANIKAELYSRDLERVFVNYDYLLENPIVALKGIITKLDLKIALKDDHKKKIDIFLDKNLKHKKADQLSFPSYLSDFPEKLFYLLGKKTINATNFDKLRNEFCSYFNFFNGNEKYNSLTVKIFYEKHFEVLSSNVKYGNNSFKFTVRENEPVTHISIYPSENNVAIEFNSIKLRNKKGNLLEDYRINHNTSFSIDNRLLIFDSALPQINVEFKTPDTVTQIELNVFYLAFFQSTYRVGIRQRNEELVKNSGLLAEKENEILIINNRLRDFQNVLLDKEKIINGKDQKIVEKDNEIEEKNIVLIKMDNEILQKNDLLLKKDTKILLKNDIINEKDNEILRKNNIIKEGDDEILQKNEIINKKDNEILEKNAVLAEKEKAIAEKNLIIEEERKKFNSKIINLSNLLSEKSNSINDLQREKEKLIKELINKKNSDIIEITSSFSWRITKPIRFLTIDNFKRVWLYYKVRKIIKKDGLFDQDYYLKNNPDVLGANIDPLKHYLLHGGFEGRNPSTKFDSEFYLSEYNDVKQAGINPLIHYVLRGKNEGRIIKEAISETFNKATNNLVENNESEEIKLIQRSNFFDVEYYLEENPDVKSEGMEPVRHYYFFGWKEGRNPSKEFNTDFYLSTYSDVEQSGMNPLTHYIRFGKKERRLITSNIKKTFPVKDEAINQIIKQNISSSGSILFISHDARLAGAEMLLLHLLKWFIKHTSYKIKIICIEGGVLLEKFESIGETIVWQDIIQNHPNEEKRKSFLKKFIDKIDLIYGNTTVSPLIYNELNFLNVPYITHVHELEKSIKKYISKSTLKNMYQYTNSYIACSTPVAKNLLKNHFAGQKNLNTVYAFIDIFDYDPSISKLEIRKKHSLKEDAFTVYGCGTIYWRKGVDLFIETAILLKKRGITNFHFYWIGEQYWDSGHKKGEYPSWNELQQRAYQEGVNSNITFLGVKDNPRDYYLAGDVFYLPSREDPFPLVALEAAECGLPIICFDKAGGMPDFVENDAGFVVPFENVKEVTDKIVYLINNNDEVNRLGKNARQKVLQKHTVNIAAPQILNLIHDEIKISPKVSIIVPVYNQEKFIKKRIESIISQTFKDYEIIILDDASNDNSYETIKSYDWHPAIKIIKNERNSGSPFQQWKKGFDLAKGEIIWIAEGDDYCESSFLHKLLPSFNDENVALAYSDSFMVDNSDNTIGDYKEYYEKLDFNHWKYSYKVTAQQEINFGLGIKNTIPNASAVLFRKRCITKEVLQRVIDFRFSGDWYFYTGIIKGGKVAFHSEKLNYHRKHAETVSTDFNKNTEAKYKLIKEAENIHINILKEYKIYPFFKEKWEEYIEEQITALFPNVKKKDYNKLYNYDYILKRIDNKTSENKKLVFVTTNDGSPTGGSEKLWREAALKSKKQGHDVLVVIKKWDPEPFFIKEFYTAGINVLFKKPGLFDSVIEYNPDLIAISTGDQDEGIDWYEFCKKNKIPYVIINQLTKEPVYWPINKKNIDLLRKGYHNAETVFFTGENNHLVMEKRINSLILNYSVLYNPLDVDRDIRLPYPSFEKGINIAILGNLLRIHKGQHLAIELFNFKKWKERPVHLNIYGNGNDELVLKQQVRNLKLNNVTFHGHTNNILEVWGKNHAILMPSFMEGLPLALVGAMLCSKVPIVTDIGAHSEIIEDNISGFIAKEPNVEALDEAMERAFNRIDEWKNIGETARLSILDYLPDDPVEHFVKQLLLYSK